MRRKKDNPLPEELCSNDEVISLLQMFDTQNIPQHRRRFIVSMMCGREIDHPKNMTKDEMDKVMYALWSGKLK